MEYSKEVIDWAREKYANAPDSEKSHWEFVFPFLKESEDERIRKEIVEYFKRYSGGDNISIKFPKWLAYLEKQKEQNPVEKQDYSGLTDFERAIHRGFLCAGVENVPVTIIKETAQECLSQVKPAEWSEEEEKLLDFWLDVVDRNDWRMDENFCKASREFINRLKSLCSHPKQDYSSLSDKEII